VTAGKQMGNQESHHMRDQGPKMRSGTREVSFREACLCSILVSFTILLAALGISLFPVSGEAAPCTKGVNCYCDKVAPGGPLADPQLLLCEDFEAATLHDNVGFGNGAPLYGPWNDDTGMPGNIGINSYWQRKYVNGMGACVFANGNVSQGKTCTYGACSGMKIWSPTNLWNANSLRPCSAGGIRNGEFNAEVAEINPPTNASGGGSGVFDGQQSYGHRNNAGLGGDAGIQGRAYWGAGYRTFGVTMALAYPNTIGSIGLNDAWKHNEWETVVGGGAGDGLLGFGVSGGGVNSSFFPFYGFMFANTGAGLTQAQTTAFTAACTAALNAATVVAGSFKCTDVLLQWFPSNAYNRATDFPFGTWGCLEAFYQNIGLSNAQWQIYFTGPSGVRKKLIDIQNFNMTWGDPTDNPTPRIQSINGYQALNWNNYYNGNYNNGTNVGTTATAYRYEDNIHIRAGAPVSCAQIGFGASGVSPSTSNPPSPPRQALCK
jgi:hypothetical protein